MQFTEFYNLQVVKNIVISLSIKVSLKFVNQEHMDYIDIEFNDQVMGDIKFMQEWAKY